MHLTVPTFVVTPVDNRTRGALTRERPFHRRLPDVEYYIDGGLLVGEDIPLANVGRGNVDEARLKCCSCDCCCCFSGGSQ